MSSVKICFEKEQGRIVAKTKACCISNGMQTTFDPILLLVAGHYFNLKKISRIF